MKLRKFEELKPFWDRMRYGNSGGYLKRDVDIIAMVTHNTQLVKRILYPDCEIRKDTRMSEYGEFEKHEDLESEVNPLFSNLMDDILWWFKNSPYWHMEYGLYGSDDIYEDGNCDGPSPAEATAAVLSQLEDDELINREDDLYNHMLEWFEYFEGTGSFSGHGYVIIVSYLYPYFETLKKCAKEEEEIIMLDYLERAYDLIGDFLAQGENNYTSTSKAGYFLNQGGNTYDDGFGSDCTDLGVCDYFYNILLAGEMVETITFALDEKYDILPEELKRKEKMDEKELQRT